MLWVSKGNKYFRIGLLGLSKHLFIARKCNTTDLENEQCSATEVCNSQNKTLSLGVCECQNGFVRINETFCQALDSSTDKTTVKTSSLTDRKGGSSIIAGIVPTFIILIVICAVYIGYKYKLHTWFKNKINQRNTNYDEFMIGQDLDDDPPLR